jgi:hypothetical protein
MARKKTRRVVEEVAAPKPVQTAITRKVDLAPEDWFLATWRRLTPLPRPEPRPFDLPACVEQVGSMKTTCSGYQWPWETCDIPNTLTPTEAHFWFTAITETSHDVSPRNFANALHKRDFTGDLSGDQLVTYLQKRNRWLPSLIVGVLRNLLTPREVVELILDPRLNEAGHGWGGGWGSPLPSTLTAGFARHLLPYLTDLERAELRDYLRPLVQQAQWPVNYYDQVPVVFYLAALCGLHLEMLDLVRNWPDGHFLVNNHSYYQRPQEIIFGLGDPVLVDLHFRRLGLRLANASHLRAWLAHTELNGLDVVRHSLLALGRATVSEWMDLLCKIEAPEIAPFLLELKLEGRGPTQVREWLEQFVGNAVCGLLRLATGRTKLAETALEYLREAKRRGHAGLIEQEIEAQPECADRIRRAVLELPECTIAAFDEASTPGWLAEGFEQAVLRKTKPVEWAGPTSLPPVLLGDRRLSNDQIQTLLLILQRAEPGARLPVIETLREQADRHALDHFAWRLCELWLAEGGPPKDKWVLNAVGLLGGEQCILNLTPLIREWPRNGQSQRALRALEAFRLIGSDLALMQMASLVGGKKVSFSVQKKARALMEEIAAERLLTIEQLEDRVVPTLDLDERGSRTFDYGPRQFRFVLGSDMKPMLRDPSGKMLTRPPNPTKKDDAEKAARAGREWKLLKKQIGEVLKSQAPRLEQAMLLKRRWAPRDFERYLVRHPLLTNLARRVVWGIFAADGELLHTFRITEEQELHDRMEQPFRLRDSFSIGLVHPVQLTEDERASWQQVFGDYEVIQPIEQLHRRVQSLEPVEEDSRELTRFNARNIPGRVVGGILKNLGWRYKHFRWKTFPADNLTAVIKTEGWDPVVAVCGCVFLAGLHDDGDKAIAEATHLRLGEVDPVVLSEVMNLLEILASRAEPVPQQ